jgi:hypothetical protein
MAAATLAAAACQADSPPATETTAPADVASTPPATPEPVASQMYACGDDTRLSIMIGAASAEVSVNEAAPITLARQGATNVYTDGAATLTVEAPNVRFAQGAAAAQTCAPAAVPAQ